MLLSLNDCLLNICSYRNLSFVDIFRFSMTCNSTKVIVKKIVDSYKNLEPKYADTIFEIEIARLNDYLPNYTGGNMFIYNSRVNRSLSNMMDYIEKTSYPLLFARPKFCLSVKNKLSGFMCLDDETLLLMDKNTINLVWYLLEKQIYVPSFF